jgi:hypothetical protein
VRRSLLFAYVSVAIFRDGRHKLQPVALHFLLRHAPTPPGDLRVAGHGSETNVARRSGGEPGIAGGFLKQCPERVPELVRVKRWNACVLALGWVSDYRYVTEHITWGYWKPTAEQMLAACEHSTSGEITTWTWGHSTITIPCSRLRR